MRLPELIFIFINYIIVLLYLRRLFNKTLKVIRNKPQDVKAFKILDSADLKIQVQLSGCNVYIDVKIPRGADPVRQQALK